MTPAAPPPVADDERQVAVRDQRPGESVTLAIRQALSSGTPPYHAAVEEVRIPAWHRHSTVLLGDAAHAMGPVWAEGAGMALEDAIVLASSR